MANKNVMMVNMKDVAAPTVFRGINLADDDKEVRGFGQPISRGLAQEMAERYFTLCERAFQVVQEIKTNPAYAVLKNMPEFGDLDHLLDPSTQTVSGVFGKEAILQILSMRHCEGIRYILGNDGQKNTVILIGVRETDDILDDNGVKRPKSAPVNLVSSLRQPLSDADVPIDVEVHKDSLTIAGVRREIPVISGVNNLNLVDSVNEKRANISDKLFGEY